MGFACSASPGAGDDDVVPDGGDNPVDAPPGVWNVDPPCTDAADDIYALGPLPIERGDIAACALGPKLDTAAVQAELNDSGAELTETLTGVRLVKLSYRTVRSNGAPTVSSAFAYLPIAPREAPAPIVLVGRPTSGIADSCAPSKSDLPQRNLSLPFAARGFITITPDYAGLGTDGTHSYLDNHDAVGQLFDAALALRALQPAGTVGEPVAAVGYSQGGGIVLSAQALEHQLRGKRTLRAVAALAPQWPISTRSFGYEDVLRNPNQITGLAGLSSPTVTVLRHYGFSINQQQGSGGETFPAAERNSIISSIESLCTVPLGGALGANQVRLGELVDATFAGQVLACIDGGGGCTGLGRAFFDWMRADFVTADPAGARVLIVQGLVDQIMPADGEAACGVAKLRAEGVEPEICSDSTATHDSVLEKKIEKVVGWVEAVVDGVAPPTCGSTTLPACSR
jgi:hypothetical protein